MAHPVLDHRYRPPLTPLLAQSRHASDALPDPAVIPARRFFTRSALELAPDLLGCLLVHHTAAGPVGGFIVEVEAYRDSDDPGCHAYIGKTERNAVLFERGGHAYVYLIYGMYHCINVSAGPAGEGTGVLIRGLEPVVGLAQMFANRPVSKVTELSAGPGRLTRALGIDFTQRGLDLTAPESPLQVVRLPAKQRPRFSVCQGKRIGITAPDSINKSWRWYVQHNPFVSKPWHGEPI